MSKPIYFVGDPHGEFLAILADLLARPPGAVVFAGDLQLRAPVRDVLAPLFADPDWNVLYVVGNHDAYDVPMWQRLKGCHGHATGDLGNRVVTLSGIEVAGLSGVFKGRVWNPKDGRPARYGSRDEWARQNPRKRWNGGLPVDIVDAIFPEDFATLGEQRCDVLVSHEAPTTAWRDLGYGEIDDLAERMRATWVVHGHHHHSSEAVLGNGVRVKSLRRREIWELPL